MAADVEMRWLAMLDCNPVEEIIERRAAVLLRRIIRAIDRVRRTGVIAYLSRLVGRPIPLPERIMIGRSPPEMEVRCPTPWNCRVAYKRIMASLVNKRVLVADMMLENVSDEVLTYWVVPHELLHMVDFEDEEIEQALIQMNMDMGNTRIADIIENRSGYLAH